MYTSIHSGIGSALLGTTYTNEAPLRLPCILCSSRSQPSPRHYIVSIIIDDIPTKVSRAAEGRVIQRLLLLRYDATRWQRLAGPVS